MSTARRKADEGNSSLSSPTLVRNPLDSVQTGQANDEDDLEVEISEPRSIKGWLRETGPANKTWAIRYVEVDADTGVLAHGETQSPTGSAKAIKGIANLRNAQILLGMNGELTNSNTSLSTSPVFYIYPEKTAEGQSERGLNFMARNKEELKTW